ncbi:MAG: DNA-binding transcriptional regulator [Pseudomonadota bacterium]
MTKNRTYRSDAANTIHGLATALHKIGAINKKTMRRFDESCLTPIHQFSAEELRALREREEVSQSVFANYLNVTTDYISKCERGERKPQGGTLKLLLLVERKGLEAIA